MALVWFFSILQLLAHNYRAATGFPDTKTVIAPLQTIFKLSSQKPATEKERGGDAKGTQGPNI